MEKAMTIQGAARLLAAAVPAGATMCPVCGTALSWWQPEQVSMHRRYHRALAVLAATVAQDAA